MEEGRSGNENRYRCMPFIFKELSEDLLFVGLTRVHGSLLALRSRPSYMHLGICVPVA